MPQYDEHFSTEADVICYNAPALILLCLEKDPQWESLDLLDCVLATENTFLKAHDLGLRTCYMGFVCLLSRRPEVLKKIGVPENYSMLVPFVLGHPKAKQGLGKRNEPIVLWVK